jgi:hypothetical protein
MSEALSFDGRMIGLQGQVVTYPQWFFAVILNTQRRLIRMAKEKTLLTGRRHEPVRVVQRDKLTGFWRLLPEIKNQLGALLNLPHHYPNKTIRALDPGYDSGRPRNCGRRPLIDLLEYGIDTTRREMRECEADLNDSRISDTGARQIVNEVKARRKPAA